MRGDRWSEASFGSGKAPICRRTCNAAAHHAAVVSSSPEAPSRVERAAMTSIAGAPAAQAASASADLPSTSTASVCDAALTTRLSAAWAARADTTTTTGTPPFRATRSRRLVPWRGPNPPYGDTALRRPSSSVTHAAASSTVLSAAMAFSTEKAAPERGGGGGGSGSEGGVTGTNNRSRQQCV